MDPDPARATSNGPRGVADLLRGDSPCSEVRLLWGCTRLQQCRVLISRCRLIVPISRCSLITRRCDGRSVRKPHDELDVGGIPDVVPINPVEAICIGQSIKVGLTGDNPGHIIKISRARLGCGKIEPAIKVIQCAVLENELPLQAV